MPRLRFMRYALAAVLLTSLSLSFLLPAPPVHAADAATTDQPPVDVAAKRQEIRERIDVARRVQEQATPESADAAKLAAAELETLKQLDAIYAQQQAATERAAALAATSEEVRQQKAQLSDTLESEPKPYSFLLLEQLRDELTTLRGRVEAQEVAVGDARTRLQMAKQQSEEKRREARRNGTAPVADPAAAAGTGDATTAAPAAPRPASVVDEMVKLREVELRNEERAVDIARRQVEVLVEKIAIVEPDTAFSRVDLNRQLETLDKLQGELENRQKLLELKLDNHIEQLSIVDDALNAPGANEELLLAERATRQEGQRSINARILLIHSQLERLKERRQIWERRFAITNGRAHRQELWKWREESDQAIAQIQADIRAQRLTIDELRVQLAPLQQRAKEADEQDLEIAQPYKQDVQLRTELIDSHRNNVASLEEYLKLEQKLVADVDAKTTSISIGDWVDYACDRAAATWKHELYSTDESGVTVGQICQGLVLLLLGLSFSRRASRAIGNRLLPRLGVNEGAASALESLIFYALLLTLSLSALRIVQVPLTMFTFMGGALAIGLGFGSQKILNNFVSGLILLIERPVRCGDLIEIDGLSGIVQHIGTRSTRISTATNVEIIVPNSTFLETNVVNWTLSDTTIRACVSVGVAYGSPAREVARWLKRAADEHGLVLAKPAPFVWFTGFGDNALEFDLHFFITMRNLSERRRIESDLRFMIDQYFNDAGIVIAYPQRDIHLDAKQAFDVRLLPATEADASGTTSASATRAA
ncbi:MAG: mechanosensitive ion channel [Pirellulales bacterium]|nr:mechanosensitive ion channel [Planctomycetales bacterium]